MVIVFTAIATAALYPQDSPEVVNFCPSGSKFFFLGLMLASFGAGCAAAFLMKRAGTNLHARSACGYAICNWLQCMLSSGIFFSDSCGLGLMANNHQVVPTEDSALFLARGVLYLISQVWMQTLIASRLELLEQASGKEFCGRCARRLAWMQAFGVTVFALLLVFSIGKYKYQFEQAAGISLWLTRFCKWVAFIIGICSLTRSLLQVSKLLRLAKLSGTSIAGESCLRQARRFAALQVLGVSLSLVLSLCGDVAVAVGRTLSTDAGLDWRAILLQACSCLGNAAAVLLLSGSHRLPPPDSQACQQLPFWTCEAQPKAVSANEFAWSPSWKEKVVELSLRGMTLRSLLLFQQEDLPSMPDWQYSPKEHKTRDVVRRVIIPLTRREESSYAVSSLNRDGARKAQIMVTHNWANCFKDLLAAVVSDALNECSFRLATQLLEDDAAFLCKVLAESRRLGDTYWICAFAVNQHCSICHSNPYDRDPLTNELHPVCNCSSVNISDPDGRSTVSEINKFDDMMYHLATTGGFRQVVAVDQTLDLFNRAWCVAEIAEAKRLQMNQALKLASKATIVQRARTLENLDVRGMRASSETDKELILNKIEGNMSIDQFNTDLQSLIFDPKSGLLASWNAMDSLQQVGEVGRLIRWGLADAGTGKVWKAWDE